MNISTHLGLVRSKILLFSMVLCLVLMAFFAVKLANAQTDTTSPIISQVSAINITPFSATINWMTNEVADAQVEFCPTYARCGNNTPIVQGTMGHSINLSGLNPNTRYYYWVKSRDTAGNLSISYARSFITLKVPDTIPPTISIISPSDGAQFSYRIVLTANASDNVGIAGVKFYRDNEILIGYEDIYSPYSRYLYASGLAQGPHTVYAVARDRDGNSTRSSSITVNVIPPPDITPPTISQVSATNITPFSATINWTTNEIADSQVEFCPTYARCGNNTPIVPGSTGHLVNISGLNPNTRYYYWVKSRDTAGNLSISYARTFITAGVIIDPTPTPTNTIPPTPTPGPDITPPIISSVTVSGITPFYASVTWTTNEPATGQIYFCTTYLLNCANSTPMVLDLTTSHVINLYQLTPSTTYYMWVKSKDASNNLRTYYRTFKTLSAITTY